MPLHRSLRPRTAASVLALTLLAGPGAWPDLAVAQSSDGGVATRIGFDIPAGPLDVALNRLASQAGLILAYDPALSAGRSSAGLQGSFTPAGALDRLLSGTSLSYRFTAADTVTLVQAPTGSTVGVDDGAVLLDPVTVYGARTTNSLEDLTASVGIVDADTLDRYPVQSLRDSLRLLANTRDGDFNDSGFVIRGLNSEGLTPGGAPLASFYIDGIQQTVQGSRRGLRGLWDVEQVEVYRGPQSTLAGRAALAGAIYLRTRDPVFRPEAALRAGIGNHDSREVAVMGNLPLLDDQVAVRVSAEYQRSESDLNYPSFERFDRFDDYTEDEYLNIRTKVLVAPLALPDTRALLTYAYAEDSPDVDDIGGPGLGFPFDDQRGDFNTPNFAEVRRTEVHNVGLEITHDLSPDLLFTAQTGFSHSDTDRPSINAGTEGETDIVTGDFEQTLATQEFRLNYFGAATDFTVGLYFAREEEDAGFRRPDFFGFASDVSRTETEADNMAVFGEISHEFLPGWRVVAGGRLDHTDQQGSSFFSRNDDVVTDFEFSRDETELLPKLGIVRELGPDHSIGFTVQRAFRAGGAGVQRASGEVFEFDAESAWNYELSYRGRLLDDRLTLLANAFYLDYQDQQVETLEDPLEPASARIVNAGNSRAYGFELEARAELAPGLSGFTALGYLDTEFEDFDSASLGDLSGLPFPEAPEWTLAAGAYYEHESGFFVGADARYTDEFLARIGQPPQEELDAYTVVNAQLGYRRGNFSATVFAENLFDEEYFLFNDNDIAATLGERRIFGVRVEARF